ncbi:sigma-70 family RNA polymerase sigma factor [Clostridium bowmanii]|uniref:sigma-70 family RNA polymerase sigma factor n=1 Tax=Clostridium bowmanii TaxID=132925 RepID=UPI001C0CFB4C|nr:sigma-70 family RNA polymerase sigma factor [Clostridium bowmanii]MBU3191547.1 sigma-70 family RNA polymerase sigma factor [Clostridium bowmanii]MCA1075849.1 sigma-70 family RNA polymerase sigma factor [Clostridium bowmanii]
MDPNIIIKSTQEQDDEEFIKLIHKCKEKLYRIAFAYLKNEQNSLDAVSQSIYKAYMNMNELKTPKFFNTWIIRILINTCNLILKHDNKVIYIEDYNEINNINESLDTEFKIDSNIDLYNSIDKLSERFKSIVILKYLEDMTISQVSEILDLPEGTVKVYLRRALKILKTELGEECM